MLVFALEVMLIVICKDLICSNRTVSILGPVIIGNY